MSSTSDNLISLKQKENKKLQKKKTGYSIGIGFMVFLGFISLSFLYNLNGLSKLKINSINIKDIISDTSYPFYITSVIFIIIIVLYSIQLANINKQIEKL